MRDDTERKTKRLSREQRREQLLDVCADLIAEEGIESVTMEAVAERADVSKGLGYAYFDNRDDMLEALFDREMAVLDAAVAAELITAKTFEEQIRCVLETWLDTVAERGPVIHAMLASNPGHSPLDAHRRSRLGNVIAFFADLVRSEYDITPVRAEVAASILLAGSVGVIDEWQTRNRSRSRTVDTFVTMCLGALDALADES